MLVRVTPRAGVWIEIIKIFVKFICGFVTPRAGVWIEILNIFPLIRAVGWSLPVRECGLKFFLEHIKNSIIFVTPRAGVWIEIRNRRGIGADPVVTPRAGVWIEMKILSNKMLTQ